MNPPACLFWETRGFLYIFAKCLFVTSVFLFRKFGRTIFPAICFYFALPDYVVTIICNFVLDIIVFILDVFLLSLSELASFRDVYFSLLFLITRGIFFVTEIYGCFSYL